jgi:hypothetical protein
VNAFNSKKKSISLSTKKNNEEDFNLVKRRLLFRKKSQKSIQLKNEKDIIINNDNKDSIFLI